MTEFKIDSMKAEEFINDLEIKELYLGLRKIKIIKKCLLKF